MEVEGAHLPVLDDETIVNTRLKHLQHLDVLHVVANVFQDVAVRDNTQRAEDDPDRDIDLDVRNGGFHNISQLVRVRQLVNLRLT